MLFILSARYINSNGTIDKQPSKKKNQFRVVKRELLPRNKQLQKTQNKCYKSK